MQTIGPETEPGHASGGLGELWRHRRLLWDFVVRDLRHRYLGSSIGFFWTVITPLFELLTYTFVFHALIGVKIDEGSGAANYALFLFCGMVTWMALSDGLSRCSSVVIEHSHLVKKVNFPVIVLPGHVIASAVLNQVIRLLVLLGAILMMGGSPSWHLLLVPVVMAIQAAMVLGVGMLLSCASIYFRDTLHWVDAVLLMGMFLTPIFYPASTYPKRFNLLLQVNPLAHLVGVYRELILNNELPHPHDFLIITMVAVFALLIGYSVFHHHRDRFSDLI
ncbi:MAG: ABC transporter permease [Myxococcota bacterium]|nr:ABC transporter permease [Myxococcota bacterium]